MPDYLQEKFDPKDLACHCGKCTTPPEVIERLKVVHAAAIEVTRYLSEEEKIPGGKQLLLIVMSAYRCEDHNRAVGGEPHSKHMLGEALDLKSAELSPDRIAKAIDHLQAAGEIPAGGLGRYGTFTHLDVRGTRARWYGTRVNAAAKGTHPGDVTGVS